MSENVAIDSSGGCARDGKPGIRLRILSQRTRLRIAFWRFLNRRGVPGFVQPFELRDRVTGNHIKIVVSPHYTTISVNNRDYYFYRESGGFDGTGTAFNCSEEI